MPPTDGPGGGAAIQLGPGRIRAARLGEAIGTPHKSGSLRHFPTKGLVRALSEDREEGVFGDRAVVIDEGVSARQAGGGRGGRQSPAWYSVICPPAMVMSAIGSPSRPHMVYDPPGNAG